MSTSYAIFTKTLSDDNSQTLSLGDLTINFAKGSTISLNNLDPETEAESLSDEDDLYSFSVVNNGDVSYNYQIALNNNPDYLDGGTSYSSSRKLLNHSYINYRFNDSCSLNLADLNGDLYSHIIDPGETEEFSLRIWVPSGELPNSVLGSEIHLKITINGKASPRRSEIESEPSDETNGSSSGSITPVVEPNVIPTLNTDSSNANSPTLATNMIPVVYNESSDVWFKTNNSQASWYNYNDQLWANAVTVVSDKIDYYNNAESGTTVEMDDILGMWVWIPRFEYMTTNLGTSYAGGTLALPGTINVKFITETSTTQTSNYLIHPAFRNGTSYKNSSNYDLGGWSQEQKGFWFGKFSTGHSEISSAEVSSQTNDILIKPDVYLMNYQIASNQYATAANTQSFHNIGSSVEAHMCKNDEWGAVTYLSQSIFGKMGNSNYSGAEKEVYPNNAYLSTGPEHCAGRSAGIHPGGSGSVSSSYGTYEYNNCSATAHTASHCALSEKQANFTKGTGASTTGNIYGVYDMSAGISTRVMANYAGTSLDDGFTSFPSGQYWTKNTSLTYTSACNGTSCKGLGWSDELGNGTKGGNYSFYQDFAQIPSQNYPWQLRSNSANNSNVVATGVFYTNYGSGKAYMYVGFRVVLSEK